ncbi:MAG: LPS assembly protein LptD [Pseudomonadota bacterium]|nr:LPS assembly protein LptD [Pseudomonadota bacterium]
MKLFSSFFLFYLINSTCFASIDNSDVTRGIACWPEKEKIDFGTGLAEGSLELTSGNADITSEGSANLEGPIELRSNGRFLSAEKAYFDRAKGIFTADGRIQYQDKDNKISGNFARYVAKTEEFYFLDTEFELGDTPARGSANNIEIDSRNIFKLHRARYTSCPAGNNDWELKAKDIEINSNKGIGTASGASLEFKGIPFLYIPYFTYPITDARKSGLLIPRLGSSDRRGFETTQPIYWNIAPNYDATFTPRYVSKRGLQLGGEFRFLTSSQYSSIAVDYLSNDNNNGLNRWQFEIKNTTELPRGWRYSLDMTGVSDDLYFDDLSSSRIETSQTYLKRNWSLEYYDQIWSINVGFSDFQTIDPEIQINDEPYTVVPSIAIQGFWRNALLGLDYSLETEATYFTRDNSIDGLRVHAEPSISIPLNYKGLYLKPKIAFDFTGYRLKDEPIDSNSSPSRSVPKISINTGAVFDRFSGSTNKWLITLEPRAQYTYIPFRNQSDFPVFDTILPDFNLVQLFRENRYLGYDRLGDTSQLSIGVTTRILESSNGQELMTATIGQTQFFDNGKVTLPGEIASSTDSSNYIAELGLNISKNWNMDFRYQFDNDINKTAKSSIRFQYSPEESKAFNIAYRYVRGSLRQTDFSAAWPLGRNWSAIGRYNYSLFENEPLDRFIGLEYESCCWGIRILARRGVSRILGQSDSAISFQFILKGFSSLGSSSAKQLERDILGYKTYSPDINFLN